MYSVYRFGSVWRDGSSTTTSTSLLVLPLAILNDRSFDDVAEYLSHFSPSLAHLLAGTTLPKSTASIRERRYHSSITHHHGSRHGSKR